MKNKTIYLLLGASASGKTTLGRYLQSIGIVELVSHVFGRNIRQGEVDGFSYYFVDDKETFDKIEKIEYTEYSGAYYCLSKKEVEDKLSTNDKVFAIVDIDGVRHIKAQYSNVVVIYITAPIDDLIARMTERGDSKANIDKRVANMVDSNELDNGKFADHIIINDDLDISKNMIDEIVGASHYISINGGERQRWTRAIFDKVDMSNVRSGWTFGMSEEESKIILGE